MKRDRNNLIDINYETEGAGIRELRQTTERKFPSDEQSDAMKEERLLLEGRKRKEALLKERERILLNTRGNSMSEKFNLKTMSKKGEH